MNTVGDGDDRWRTKVDRARLVIAAAVDELIDDQAKRIRKVLLGFLALAVVFVIFVDGAARWAAAAVAAGLALATGAAWVLHAAVGWSFAVSCQNVHVWLAHHRWVSGSARRSRHSHRPLRCDSARPGASPSVLVPSVPGSTTPPRSWSSEARHSSTRSTASSETSFEAPSMCRPPTTGVRSWNRRRRSPSAGLTRAAATPRNYHVALCSLFGWAHRADRIGVAPSWRPARPAIGVPDLRPHDLRRTPAATLDDRGVPLQGVSFLLRHLTLDATRVYLRPNPSRSWAHFERLVIAVEDPQAQTQTRPQGLSGL